MDALGNSVPEMDVAVDIDPLEEVQSCLHLAGHVCCCTCTHNEKPEPHLHWMK